jgi:type I restriction enzyme M protein
MSTETSHLDKSRLNNLAVEIWKSAERLRGKFKAHEYQNVVLPIITIRRLECVLIKWREAKTEEIREKRKKITDEVLTKLVKGMELNPKQSPGFSNETTWTMRKVYEEDHTWVDAFRTSLCSNSQTIADFLRRFADLDLAA